MKKAVIISFLVIPLILYGEVGDSIEVDSTSIKFVEDYIEKAWNKPYKEALPIYNKAIELNDQIAIVYWRRGDLYHKNGDFMRALEDFTKTIELDSTFNSGYAFWNRALVKEALRNYLGALSDYDQAVRIGPKQQNFVCFRGILKYKLKDKEGALLDLNKAIELWDDYYLARRWRAPIRTEQGEYKKAMDDYNKIKFKKRDEDNPNWAYDFFLRGVARFETGDKEGACSDWNIASKNYLKAFEYFKENCLEGKAPKETNETLEKTLELIETTENYGATIDLLNDYISKNSNSSEAHWQRAKCLRRTGKYAEAKKDAETAIKLDTLNANAYCELGTIYAMTRRPTLALKNYNIAINLDPGNSKFYSNRGALNDYFLKQIDQALLDYSKAILLNPTNQYALLGRGLILLQKDKYLEAIDDFNSALEIEPKDNKTLYNRGLGYYYNFENKKSIKDLNAAIKYNDKADPFDILNIGEIYYYIGLNYDELGKTKKYKKYMDLAKENGFVE